MKYKLGVLPHWRSNAVCTQMTMEGIQQIWYSNCAKADNSNCLREDRREISIAVYEDDAISRCDRKAGAGNEESKCLPGHRKGESKGQVAVVAIRDIYEVDEVDEVDEEEEEDLSDKSETTSDDVDDDHCEITTEDKRCSAGSYNS